MTLQEIDKRLDLLKEYIGYRADWLAKYNGHHSKHFYFLKEHRILPIGGAFLAHSYF